MTSIESTAGDAILDVSNALKEREQKIHERLISPDYGSFRCAVCNDLTGWKTELQGEREIANEAVKLSS